MARWFDPSLGRFTSPDSIIPTSTQGTQAWDRYAFVNNNPVRYNDPTGHDATPPPNTCTGPFNPYSPLGWQVTLSGENAIKFIAAINGIAGDLTQKANSTALIGGTASAVAAFIPGVGPALGVVGGLITATESTYLSGQAENVSAITGYIDLLYSVGNVSGISVGVVTLLGNVTAIQVCSSDGSLCKSFSGFEASSEDLYDLFAKNFGGPTPVNDLQEELYLEEEDDDIEEDISP